MAMPKVKFSLTIKELSFNFEGDQTLGQSIQRGVQDTLNGIADTQMRVMGVEPDDGRTIDAIALPAPKRKNRRRAAPATNGDGKEAKNGKGSRPGSLTNLIEALIAEGVFGEERLTADIQQALENRGHNYDTQPISTALLHLTKQQKLTRRKTDEGKYLYKSV